MATLRLNIGRIALLSLRKETDLLMGLYHVSETTCTLPKTVQGKLILLNRMVGVYGLGITPIRGAINKTTGISDV